MAFPEITPRALALVALGGLAGTLARYAISGLLTRGTFPWGTAAVNLTGSFALGLFMFSGMTKGVFGPDVRLFVAVGFLGAYTTMSTFAFETVAFLDDGDYFRAGVHFLVNPVLSVAGAFLGRALAYAAPAAGGG